MRLIWAKEQSRFHELLSELVYAISRSRWMLLLAVLALGLLFRLLDIMQPFIGYHMWNEVYYVTIARNFEHFGLLSVYNYDWIGGSPLSQRSGPSPFVSWLVYFSSQALGMAEWVARLPILVLGMFSLVAIYFIARELYGNQVGLGTVFFAAIMPGIVFFSRQVALDGPMTAFGLAAVWILLLAKRRHQYRWLLLSAVLLGISIFIKYTAVLFLPSLAWIWLKTVPRSEFTKKATWALPIVYLLIAVIPAASWFVFTSETSSTRGGLSPVAGYLNRAYEWRPEVWRMALMATWPRLADHIGHILWYPLALAATLALATGRLVGFVRQYLDVILLIVPWFAQAVYPWSWAQNDNYAYPLLYGVAVLLALLLREALRLAQQRFDLSGRNLRVSASLLGLLVFLSCLMDYKEVFHSWYIPSYTTLQLPANVVTEYDPYYSARLVRAINVSHQPILADLPTTLYYAQDEYWSGRAVWLWWGLTDEQNQMIDAIRSKEFRYVVFTYRPPVEIADALARGNYRLIGPAVWENPASP